MQHFVYSLLFFDMRAAFIYIVIYILIFSENTSKNAVLCNRLRNSMNFDGKRWRGDGNGRGLTGLARHRTCHIVIQLTLP